MGSSAGPTVRVSGSSLKSNGRYGARIDGGHGKPSIVIASSTLRANAGDYDLQAFSFADPAETIVWATDCWWGTSEIPAIGERIYDHDDASNAPLVYVTATGGSCDPSLGRDSDGDALGDFEDNCPDDSNPAQIDTDGDRMGDACDPEEDAEPTGPCNGFDDVADGYADADGDGWGDPCDPQPMRADSHPDASEHCDTRDNNGDAVFRADELVDADLDGGVSCGDCDDLSADVEPCACEDCVNMVDDDCDGSADEADLDCAAEDYCFAISPGSPDPQIEFRKGACGPASAAGPYEILQGNLLTLRFDAGSVDLGEVGCVADNVPWDRYTDTAAAPNPACASVQPFYLVRGVGAGTWGSASSGEPRDRSDPDPACP